MQRNAFDPSFEELPRSLPLFPLSGVLLLPRGRLPLNVFEPRYLAMTREALATPTRLVGMIQPAAPDPVATNPDLYPSGCAGRITSFSETDDGRFLITLTGVIRFAIAEELPLRHGFRSVVPDYSAFKDDLVEDVRAPGAAPGVERDRLLAAVRGYFACQGMTANWDVIQSTPDERLVTSLSMVCPFAPQEKQALLEAPTLSERAKLIVALMEMALHEGASATGAASGRPCH
ncbi:MAG: LON peptidase substrate-binding domain-containing protein [Alphaproteobacteria bacterium]|nr:LON peptidase substrate-binding domain-containing protein [Alphaproteobacteria bacterium]